MKSYKSLWNDISSLKNITKAYHKARKNKNYYSEILEFKENLAQNLFDIHTELSNGTYTPLKMREKLIFDGKPRTLHISPFRDRVVHWAIMLQLEKIFVNFFHSNSCASITGLGTLGASKKTRKYIKKYKFYLKIDIEKYYPSIPQHSLKEKLRVILQDPEALKHLDLIVDSLEGGKGLPIGSYLSQYLANFYLSFYDKLVKAPLVRFMDDIVIFSNSKKELHELLNWSKEYCLNELGLNIKSNAAIRPVTEGIDFVGYVHYPSFTKLRKSTKLRMIAKMREISKKESLEFSDFASFMSYYGFLIHCNSKMLFRKHMLPILPKILKYHYENCNSSKFLKFLNGFKRVMRDYEFNLLLNYLTGQKKPKKPKKPVIRYCKKYKSQFKLGQTYLIDELGSDKPMSVRNFKKPKVSRPKKSKIVDASERVDVPWSLDEIETSATVENSTISNASD